jgi:hypothetical protein
MLHLFNRGRVGSSEPLCFGTVKILEDGVVANEFTINAEDEKSFYKLLAELLNRELSILDIATEEHDKNKMCPKCTESSYFSGCRKCSKLHAKISRDQKKTRKFMLQQLEEYPENMLKMYIGAAWSLQVTKCPVVK